ncbi:MAG: hypothetical protein O3C21_15950 [Verrucomicrobia bacterium]|nr:hypothetical protein [Verrucomicrobiota bacterium]
MSEFPHKDSHQQLIEARLISILEGGAWMVLALLGAWHIVVLGGYDRFGGLQRLPWIGTTVIFPVLIVLIVFAIAGMALSHSLRQKNGTIDRYLPAFWKRCSVPVKILWIVLSLYAVAFGFGVAFSYFPDARPNSPRIISVGLLVFHASSLIAIHTARRGC